MTDTKLKSYVDRIENLEEERKAINGDVRDIYTEAKSNGYNPKAIRKIVALRKQKDDAQLEADIETYKAALGMHGTYRAAAEKLGVSKSKLQRLVPRVNRGTATPPHDSETGEISEQPDDCRAESRPLPEGQRSGSAGVGEGDAEVHGERGTGDAAERRDVPPLQAPLGEMPAANTAAAQLDQNMAARGVAPGPQDTGFKEVDHARVVHGEEVARVAPPALSGTVALAGEIDITIPARLDRRGELASLRAAADPGSRSAQ